MIAGIVAAVWSIARRVTHYSIRHLPKELALALVAAVMYEYLHEIVLAYLEHGGG